MGPIYQSGDSFTVSVLLIRSGSREFEAMDPRLEYETMNASASVWLYVYLELTMVDFLIYMYFYFQNTAFKVCH